MGRLRVLLLGPDCHPSRKSIPFVTYSHAAALAELHEVTLVARSYVEDALRSAKAPFRAIETVRMPALDRVQDWSTRAIIGKNYSSHLKTAFGLPFHIAFECRVWQQFKGRILSGEFDVVLRILPMTPVIPSPIAFFLRRGSIPLVVGPIQASLPFHSGFSQANNQKQWVDNFRNLYRILPFARSTYRNATAIIVASSQAYAEFERYRDKLFFVPEPGIGASLCANDSRNPQPGAKLELIFVGGLIPCKACDLGIRAAAPLLKKGLARFTVVGDGPERNRLEKLAGSLGVADSVTFCGWLSHPEALKHMRRADVFVFPSVRDNGAGVVFEALASGAVPVVADFGGPGDIVHPEVGYKIPLTNESEFISQMESILKEIAGNRELLRSLRQRGMVYARERLTWDAKAQCTTQVLNWAVRRSQKPVLIPPKMLRLESAN